MKHDIHVSMKSRLALGTVQFGLNYGIANKTGMPSEEYAHTILDAALDLGIRCFDTAQAYGDSEKVLGSWARKHEAGIVSKYSDAKTDSSVADSLAASIKLTLERLGLPCLHGYLLHDEELIGDTRWLSGMRSLKDAGFVGKIGISIYRPECAMEAAKSQEIDIIQIPYSIMDQRLDQCEFFDLAEANGKEVWARSALVQGLLLLEEEKIPVDLQGMIPLRDTARTIGAHYGFSMQQMAILFSLGNPRIDNVLIGVDTLEQLLDFDGIEKHIDAFQDCRGALIRELRGRVDPYIVSPHRWKR